MTGRTRVRRIFDTAMIGALCALAVASGAATASGWVPRLEAFGNLQGHFAALSAGMLVAALLGRANGWVLGAAGLLALNIATIGVRLAPVTTCPIQMAATNSQQAVRVLTQNIWRGNLNFAAIERLLQQQDPDVVVMQEVRPHHRPLLEKLRGEYPFQALCNVHETCGIAIVSRYPIKNEWQLHKKKLSAVVTAIAVEGHELVVMGTHMTRPFRGRSQSAEFDALTPIVAALPHNAIVAGDFNSVPWSANMARYIAGAGVCASNATHATWPQWLGPFGIPIDHLFLKPEVRLLSLAALGGTGSDHKALLATVSIP